MSFSCSLFKEKSGFKKNIFKRMNIQQRAIVRVKFNVTEIKTSGLKKHNFID